MEPAAGAGEAPTEARCHNDPVTVDNGRTVVPIVDRSECGFIQQRYRLNNPRVSHVAGWVDDDFGNDCAGIACRLRFFLQLLLV